MSTEEKKQAFLDNYPKLLVATQTCKAIGIGEATHYDWLRTDEEYSKAFVALKKRVDSDRLDRYEVELDHRALGGTSKQSDILLMFGLKALKPDVYREKVAGPLIAGDIKIIWSLPGYDESLRLKSPDIIEGEAKEVT